MPALDDVGVCSPVVLEEVKFLRDRFRVGDGPGRGAAPRERGLSDGEREREGRDRRAREIVPRRADSPERRVLRHNRPGNPPAEVAVADEQSVGICAKVPKIASAAGSKRHCDRVPTCANLTLQVPVLTLNLAGGWRFLTPPNLAWSPAKLTWQLL